MDFQESNDLIAHFQNLEDPRIERCRKHELIDIFVIAICAVICGADTWTEIETFGKERKDWLATFLTLENGIPSHDTFCRVFGLLNPKEFQECFVNWTRSITRTIPGEIISIDGKTSRRSHDRKKGKKPLHLVSAWANSNRVILAQVKTDEKSNEITAISDLFEYLNINGCIVTIDAMGTQTAIAKQIIDGGGDYVLALKANQETLYNDVKLFIDEGINDQKLSQVFQTYHTEEKNHGRYEKRTYYVTNHIDWLEQLPQWSCLESVGMVEAQRTIENHSTIERRYYISSLTADAKIFANAVRGHWGIENKVHWLLDVAFNDDLSRTRKGKAPENFATLKRIALNVLKQDTTYKKRSIKTKRFTAALNHEYLKSLVMRI